MRMQLLVGCVLAALLVPVTAGAAMPARADTLHAARFVPLAPVRVVDTRPGEPTYSAGTGESFRSAAVTRVDVLAGPGVPEQLAAAGVTRAEVTAVVVNATLVEAIAHGFLTLWPTGTVQPLVSNLNVVPGSTRPNLATVPVGDDSTISAWSQSKAHLVIDLAGVYVAASSATAGRFVPLGPTRVADTRDPAQRAAVGGRGRLGPGDTVTIDFTGHGVPSDATAIVFNLTATDADVGFFTVLPDDGSGVPLVSSLNIESPGMVRANQVIVRTTNGRARVFARSGGNVIVDVAGYYTGAGAPASANGLFVAVTPVRLLDTRDGRKPFAGSINGASPEAKAPGAGAASAQVLNITLVGPEALGFIAGYPAGAVVPSTSSVNTGAYPWGLEPATANHAIISSGIRGDVRVFTSSRAHVVVDLFGYFTGSPTVLPDRPVGPAPNLARHGTDYEFFDGQISPSDSNGGAPAAGWPLLRWFPGRCDGVPHDITYFVDPEGASPSLIDAAGVAVATVEKATGFDYVEAASAADAQLIVRFLADGDRVGGDVAGAIDFTGFRYEGPNRYITGAEIVVRRALSYSTALPVLMHEFGHTLGLQHVGDSSELMFPIQLRSSFGDGDLEGLRLLGIAAGCHQRFTIIPD